MLHKKTGHVWPVFLFLLGIDRVGLGDWIELFQFKLFAWVFLVLIIVTRVVHVTLADSFVVALGYHLYQSIL